MRVGRSQLARYARVSAPAVTKAIKTRRLTVLEGKWIDLDASDTRSFLAGVARRGIKFDETALNPGAPPESSQAPTRPPQAKSRRRPPPMNPRERDAPPVDEAVAEFLEKEHALKLENLKQTIFGRRLKNAQTIGTLVLRDDIVKGLVDPINTVFVRMLTDLSKSLAGRIVPMVMGGSDEAAVEQLMRDEHSAMIRALKAKMRRALKEPVA